jgi:hypothetical protein
MTAWRARSEKNISITLVFRFFCLIKETPSRLRWEKSSCYVLFKPSQRRYHYPVFLHHLGQDVVTLFLSLGCEEVFLESVFFRGNNLRRLFIGMERKGTVSHQLAARG